MCGVPKEYSCTEGKSIPRYSIVYNRQKQREEREEPFPTKEKWVIEDRFFTGHECDDVGGGAAESHNLTSLAVHRKGHQETVGESLLSLERDSRIRTRNWEKQEDSIELPSLGYRSTKRLEGMTGRSNALGTRLCLLALLLSCLSTRNILVAGEPDPIPPELLYSDSFADNADNLILLNKLKLVTEERRDMAEREKALNEEQSVIQSVLEARARAKARAQQGDFTIEELPVPNAVVSQPQHSGKRTAISYMTLCHFKICNMGRKRQLNK